MTSAAEALDILKRGTVTIHSEKELAERLSRGKPLRIKFGADPTAPDIHLGHAVPLRKLRQFQELGHHIVLIIGDFTAMIGDPTGRSTTRPPLTHEEVVANAKTYTEQAFLVLDRDKTEVVFNGDWLRAMTFSDVVKLNARVTLQQMLQREDFKNRVAQGQEVRLHELQYPIMQGWDSVVVRADVEIGGSDQLFNMLVGRDLQKEEGQEPQIVMTMPLLEGLDGVKKMSKSLGNYVGLTEEPKEMFGKLMSIPDELMAKYYLLVLGEVLDVAMHPMEAKKQLAAKCVAVYHSEADARACREDWDTRFSKRDLSGADLPVVTLGERRDVLGVVLFAYAEAFQHTVSGGDARRLIQQGSVQLNGEKVVDPKATPEWKEGDILKLDKKRTVKVQG
ncbi:tyrosine--tRNA ligase [Phragmitibacter flavus]|uniref:Tyrosine--tRNA ligase n=1 Tax=Phragmitibacter flavus TaxID=2576071 RepID=A0A5R8KL41_9BACT|nr:tyrosine--tRNA ligase [Phragmitibacter flavus]TLD72379.1 tyrosine--tRNA ligase [Phragmitibacter flavus]